MSGLGLAGKIAIVTGAGRGLGFAFAKGLADEGAKVVVADINGDNANRGAAEITAHRVLLRLILQPDRLSSRTLLPPVAWARPVSVSLSRGRVSMHPRRLVFRGHDCKCEEVANETNLDPRL